MKTIALRFSDKFAPSEGTIEAHKKIIDKSGYVWYGKLGNPVSRKLIDELNNDEQLKILLIHSGKSGRYWACVDKIQRNKPEEENIPSYYRDNADMFKTWFKIRKFEVAEKNIMEKCVVVSSKVSLSKASRSSMSPYFIIEYNNNEEQDDNTK